MMEKIKTASLAVLVMASLLQSYLLVYGFPNLGAKVATGQSYVQTETMGPEEQPENLIYPEEIVLHFGSNQHTELSPGSAFFDHIFGAIQLREFSGFERTATFQQNWSRIRNSNPGVELRFGEGIPVSLLLKVKAMKLSGDITFLSDTINRIWIYKETDTERVRVFFFGSGGQTMYESTRADLTLGDLQDYLSSSAAWTPYRVWNDRIYLPDTPIQAVEYAYGYETYSPERMQRNLFFDPATSKLIQDPNGSQLYTDGKRSLQMEQQGTWMSYTDPLAEQDAGNDLTDNALAAVQYINQHGGWDGVHRFVGQGTGTEGSTVIFQQYHNSYPVIGSSAFRFGEMRLLMQQGDVAEYERSLLTLGESRNRNELRWLPGGDTLQNALSGYSRKSEVVSLYPALRASLLEGEPTIRLEPVWAVRLSDGSQDVLLGALPKGTKLDETTLPKLKTDKLSVQDASPDSTTPGAVLVDPGAADPLHEAGKLNRENGQSQTGE